MTHVTYKYTYKYSGPASIDSLPLSPPDAVPRKQNCQHRHHRSASTPKEDRSSRPLYLPVNNHHYGHNPRKGYQLPHNSSPDHEARLYRDPDGLVREYGASEQRGTRYYSEDALASELYNDSSSPLLPKSQPTVSSEHKCILASPLPTTPAGCLIPGTQLVLNIPRALSSTPTFESSKNDGLTHGYIFPTKHAIVNLIEPGCLPFDGTGGFLFQVYKVPTCLILRDFINQIAPSKPRCTERAPCARGIIECINVDNCSWERGQEFWIGGPRGDLESMKVNVKGCTLEDVGWTEEKSPIWVARTFV
ncbi:hypothetical protein PISL3812_02676 [Talaromyces islandicus]|uniref:Uncharacterized protein n=1 Tax=Talaromyces islandicus TaxID=28573 RepID=A0A0U1LQY5_TALIS|nr:hypothetical protein PISL3812_02676 [Talaromyces islandicus]